MEFTLSFFLTPFFFFNCFQLFKFFWGNSLLALPLYRYLKTTNIVGIVYISAICLPAIGPDVFLAASQHNGESCLYI